MVEQRQAEPVSPAKALRHYVHAVRLVYTDADRRCQVLRTVGYRAATYGGWHGPTRRTVAEVRADIAEHKLEQERRPETGEAVEASGETVGC